MFTTAGVTCSSRGARVGIPPSTRGRNARASLVKNGQQQHGTQHKAGNPGNQAFHRLSLNVMGSPG